MKGQGTRRGVISNSLSLLWVYLFLALVWTSSSPLWASNLLCLLAYCLLSKTVSVENWEVEKAREVYIPVQNGREGGRESLAAFHVFKQREAVCKQLINLMPPNFFNPL